MKLYPRSVYFVNGRAIGAGFSCAEQESKKKTVVMFLPSEHPDFLGPINVLGKTQEQIELEVKAIPSFNG